MTFKRTLVNTMQKEAVVNNFSIFLTSDTFRLVNPNEEKIDSLKQEGTSSGASEEQRSNSLLLMKQLHNSKKDSYLLICADAEVQYYMTHMIRTWTVRSRNHTTRIWMIKHLTLGVNKVKWTGIGQFHSNSGNMLYSGNDKLRSIGVAPTVRRGINS